MEALLLAAGVPAQPAEWLREPRSAAGGPGFALSQLSWAAAGLAASTALLVVAAFGLWSWMQRVRRAAATHARELDRLQTQLAAETQERRRFASVIEATSDFVALAELGGRLIYLNLAGRRMAGLPASADIGARNLWEFYPEETRRQFQATTSAPAGPSAQGLPWTGEAQFHSLTGSEIPVSFVGLVIHSAEGKPDYLACIARDLTGRIRVEEDLRAALAGEKELNQLKSNFTSMVSHEFRTPLGVIQSSSELLQGYFDRLTPERREKLLAAITTSSQDMARMMEDVLLLGRVESARYEFQPRQVSLGDLAQRLAEEAGGATHSRCPIEVSVGPMPELGWCDEALVLHILRNLLSNAIKYSPPGAAVRFEIHQDGQDAVFTVVDRGCGIPEKDRALLFQAFRRGSNVGDTPGTGLGLVIVQRCAGMHGGWVALDATPGGGTTATARLPLFAGKDSNTALFRRWRSQSTAPTPA